MKLGRSTEFTKASIENYSKDGLSILIRLLQMWQAMKAEWNIQGCIFCGWESKGADLWGVTDHDFGQTGFL
jgi:hypothetical protein